ncbi:MAG: dTDP-4-dehydrorhamnose reductase [Muribaculaceae bacterium]|nr:dTDP-4-dehydrorhamnose reductase [Muribaculaceae bacterium]
MKILVCGANGQLGREMRNVLERRCPGVTTYVDREELDLCDAAAVELFLRQGGFSRIINCAAYTDVEKAEEEKHECAAANIDAVANLARRSDELGIRILHVSTDYVFDGTRYRPYTESDKVNPMSHYGTTKRKGETALLALAPESIIVRTGWLYSPFGHNFLLTMLRLGSTQKHVRVVEDQIGTPTYAADLAEAIATIVLSQQWIGGIYNFSNEGVCSWYDFAFAIMTAAGKSCRVEPIPSSEYPAVVTRPFYSVLDKTKIKATFGITIPHWFDGLKRCLARVEELSR